MRISIISKEGEAEVELGVMKIQMTITKIMKMITTMMRMFQVRTEIVSLQIGLMKAAHVKMDKSVNIECLRSKITRRDASKSTQM